MAKKLSDLVIGTLVKDNQSKYYEVPIIWRILDKNHSGYPANSVTLISEKILCLKPFDALEPNNSNGHRTKYGNNRYTHSNLRQWLNSNSQSWYSPTHSADSPPGDSIYSEELAERDENWWWNLYEKEAGFLRGFSEGMRNALLSTNVVVNKNTVTDGGGSETCTDKIFLPSYTEVGLGNHANISEGTAFSMFGSAYTRCAYTTSEANRNNNSWVSPDTNTWHWWLRTSGVTSSYEVISVGSAGQAKSDNANYAINGVRPLCNVSSGLEVSDTPDSDGAYIITEWNRAPTAPQNIIVPEKVLGGKNLTVEWGAAIDLDDNLSGYILQRAYNGTGSFSQVYKGSSQTYTESILLGRENVTYRVKAYDTVGAESGYTTSPTRTIINNAPPSINGQDENLGVRSEIFNIDYIVTDSDTNDVITIVETIDGIQKRNFVAVSGQKYSFNMPITEWQTLLNGNHTLTITATDSYDESVTRTYTFIKSETEIELTLSEPLSTDEKIEKAIMNITRQIPLGAIFKVEVCNNGNDESPTWEDVTSSITQGSKFFFSNTQKTADKWGFNFRIKINRNNASGECFISAAGGNFEQL